jgi:hypothetical protein
MREDLPLSETEWTLIVELLERELRELPQEIHHTRTASVREALNERRRTVTDLLHRMQTPTAV